jgi:hypothetical protein
MVPGGHQFVNDAAIDWRSFAAIWKSGRVTMRVQRFDMEEE